MKRLGLAMILLGIAWTVLNEHTSERPSAPSPSRQSRTQVQPKKATNIHDSPTPDLGASGYCGAKRPPDFRRPGISDLLNRPTKGPGNQARGLYNRGEAIDAHLDNWATSDPESPYPFIWRAHLFLQKRDAPAALLEFEKAREHLPDDPILALLMANILAHTPELPRAIKMLELYTQHYPADLPKRQELARLQTQSEIQSRYENLEFDGLTILYPPETQHLDWLPFIHWLDDRLEEAASFTGTPKRRALTIVAFEGKAELLATTCTPTWTGGVYDGSIKLAMKNLDTLPSKTTSAHETLHAQLSHALRRPIPAWFSEGLAQAFAQEAPFARRSWRQMVEHQTYIPFPSLGDSFLEFHGSDDARLAYHQGLAMVLWVLEEDGEDRIQEMIQMLHDPKTGHRELIESIQINDKSEDFLRFIETML